MIDKRFIRPEVLVTNFHIRPGDKVGDFGAGAGNFATFLSKAVGSTGLVYACEVQKTLADKLSEKVQLERLSNVKVLWSDFEEIGGSKLEDGLLDVAVMVNTLFQLENRQVAMEEIYRVLRPGGKLVLVDWSESWSGLGPTPTDVINERQARDLIESVRFTFERAFDAGDHHYGLAFRK